MTSISPHWKHTRPTDMETDKRCPFCMSASVRLWDTVLRVRTVPVVGGPGEDRNYLVFRCLTCGQNLDEIEADPKIADRK